jgi:signal transduction histidine kinase
VHHKENYQILNKQGGNMRKIISITFVLVLCLCLAGNVFAESATKEEIIAKVREAATMITNEGQDAAFTEINNKEGKFVWKDSYVFVFDLEGTLLARAFRQQGIGKNLLEWPDKSNPPKQPIKEMVDVVKDKGEGWVEYWYPKPKEQAPSKKTSFVYRVPGKNLFVGAGIYE